MLPTTLLLAAVVVPTIKTHVAGDWAVEFEIVVTPLHEANIPVTNLSLDPVFRILVDVAVMADGTSTIVDSPTSLLPEPVGDTAPARFEG